MLWAIDVGNTHTVVGLYEGGWKQVWRLATHSGDTEDQLMATLGQLCEGVGLLFRADEAVIGSVVPSATPTWQKFASKWLQCAPKLLESGAQVGLEVTYDPPHAVGADRIANALAAIELVGAPAIIVDFGTATTFDTIDAQRRYVGGSIMPGVLVSLDALAARAAKLPSISLAQPDAAIGRNTVDALRSGVMLGYAGAVDNVLKSIKKELGGNPPALGTGGLASAFLGLCSEFDGVEPNLTLDGLRLALPKL
ncbi:MAG: type III pantothenate kinase [Armatimonadetes bacterium]|nr:type III pantothenate kinase [Armatimonadota bacterium]